MKTHHPSPVPVRIEVDIDQILRRILQDDAFREEFEQRRSIVLSKYELTSETRSALMALNVPAYIAKYKELSPTVGGAII